MMGYAVPHAFEPRRLDQPCQPVFASLAADPERDRGPDHRADRREHRIEPEQFGLARGQDDDGEVDPERQKEDQRGVERAHQDEAARREEVSEQ